MPDTKSVTPEGSKVGSTSKADTFSQMSSFEVFVTFVEQTPTGVCVDKVFSKECYEMWLKSRAKEPKQPTESFRRALTSHVRGTDQRKPFLPHVEAALLVKLREKKNWDCFEKLGRYGFRGQGFHESKRALLKRPKKRKLVNPMITPHGLNMSNCGGVGYGLNSIHEMPQVMGYNTMSYGTGSYNPLYPPQGAALNRSLQQNMLQFQMKQAKRMKCPTLPALHPMMGLSDLSAYSPLPLGMSLPPTASPAFYGNLQNDAVTPASFLGGLGS